MMMYMKIKIFVFAMSCFTLTAFGQGGNSIEKRIDELVSQMTLQEKIGQMNQLTGMGLSKNMKESVKTGKVGTILNELNVEVVNELQRIAVEESRLHIPLIVARGVIHGFKTIFPIPLGQVASWNPEVAEEGARVAAMEASATGIRWTFAPMIDVSRDPRWGRIAESCGEDPYLTSMMGVAMVKGFRGQIYQLPQVSLLVPNTLRPMEHPNPVKIITPPGFRKFCSEMSIFLRLRQRQKREQQLSCALSMI